MKTLLVLSILCFNQVIAQSVTIEQSRKIEIINPLLVKELRSVLKSDQRMVYLCSVDKETDKTVLSLEPVGYISELKNRPASLYTVINDNILLFRTGFEELAENRVFFEKVIQPLTKGRLINDLLPNGNINPDTPPYAGYDPINIIITLQKDKIISIRKEQIH